MSTGKYKQVGKPAGLVDSAPSEEALAGQWLMPALTASGSLSKERCVPEKNGESSAGPFQVIA